MKIVFTRHGHHDPTMEGGMLARWWDSIIIHGAKEWELLKGLDPRSDEPILDKNRYSAFHGTNLFTV